MKPRRVFFVRGPSDCPLEKNYRGDQPKSDRFYMPHWHTQMEFCYVTQGQLEICNPEENFTLSQGDIYIAPPDQVHGLRVQVDGSCYWTVVFSPELITVPENHFFHTGFIGPLREERLQIPKVIRQNTPGYDTMLSHLESLLAAEETAPDYKATVYICALSFCLSLMNLCSVLPQGTTGQHSGTKGNDTIAQCARFISSHYSENITLAQLSELVHLHPNYLCRLFKQHCGQTIFEYLNAVRISFAGQFIRNTNESIDRIAEKCGFHSMSYFNKKFKEHTGITPHAYSKLYKNR